VASTNGDTPSTRIADICSRRSPSRPRYSRQLSRFTLITAAAWARPSGSLNGDVKQAGNDLATTKSDASQGQGTDCTNVQSTVYNDAASTLYNDQESSLTNDVDSLSRDISSVRGDIGTVNSDLQALQADGVSAPSGAGSAISSAQSAIASAIGQANPDINSVQSDVSQGFSIANGLAYGNCAGDGPGNPPAGIQPVS
jgi:hypothetical protein